MRLLIAILNYRVPELAVQCLRSLPGAVEAAGWRVVVVDNASGDGSVECITAAIERESWDRWASVLPLDHNGGYSAGNNAGIRQALADQLELPEYVLLLNPDTIVRLGALAELVRFMDEHPGVGVAGSRLEEPTEQVQCSAHRFPSPAGELLGGARLGPLNRLLPGRVVSPPVRDEAHPCDWVSGASMMVRRSVFEQVGLLDEGYFLYFDEVDFCYRARRAGWEVWYVPQARVVHLEGASTGIRTPRKRRPAYWYDSRRRFFLKAYGLGGLILADALWATGRLSWLARRCVGLAGKGNDPKWFAWDLLMGDLRAILSGRARVGGRGVHD